MAKKKLGKKYACYQCGCKFYDLSRPKAVCPKCGADQKEAPTKDAPSAPKTGTTAAAPPRTRGRRRRDDEASIGASEPYSEDEVDSGSGLEDGLSLIDDEELIGSSSEEYSEED
jgi:hypothetical protein